MECKLLFSSTSSATWMRGHWTSCDMTAQGRFVCPGGPADGRLVPGDQLVKINNVAVDDLTPEQAAEIIRSPLTTTDSHAHTHIHTDVWLLVHSTTTVDTSLLMLTSTFFRECQDSLTVTALRTMLVSLLYHTSKHTFAFQLTVLDC